MMQRTPTPFSSISCSSANEKERMKKKVDLGLHDFTTQYVSCWEVEKGRRRSVKEVIRLRMRGRGAHSLYRILGRWICLAEAILSLPFSLSLPLLSTFLLSTISNRNQFFSGLIQSYYYDLSLNCIWVLITEKWKYKLSLSFFSFHPLLTGYRDGAWPATYIVPARLLAWGWLGW